MQKPRRERGCHRPTPHELQELGLDPAAFADPNMGVAINDDWRDRGAFIGLDASACIRPHT
jgi:hypothetical protein